MDKFTRKYLRKIISETYSGDMDEMAYRAKGVRDDKGKIVAYKPFFREDNDTPNPDYWIVNPRKIQGEEILVVPLGCEELESFIESNKEWLEKIQETHSLEPQLAACTRGKYKRPIEKWVEGGYKPTGKKYSESERIVRKLNKILINELENEGFKKVLNLRSIPEIKIEGNRTGTDIHNENISNQEVRISTHYYDYYDTLQFFLESVIKRIKGETVEPTRSRALERQYNQKYRNYDAARAMEKTYMGKTKKTGKDSRGYEEKDINQEIRNDFEINGEMINDNSFSWNLRVYTRLGRKTEKDGRLKGGLLDDRLFQSTATAQIEPGTEFNDKYTIMDNESIVNALIESINDLKSQIESTSPKEVLTRATLKRYELGESVKKKLIERIIQKVIK
jgi:hypothetical protein